MAANVGFVGCLGLCVALRSKNLLRIGVWTAATSILLLILSFWGLGIHGWFGSATFTLLRGVFCAGLAFLAIGGVRELWQKFRVSRLPSRKAPGV